VAQGVTVHEKGIKKKMKIEEIEQAMLDKNINCVANRILYDVTLVGVTDATKGIALLALVQSKTISQIGNCRRCWSLPEDRLEELIIQYAIKEDKEFQESSKEFFNESAG